MKNLKLFSMLAAILLAFNSKAQTSITVTPPSNTPPSFGVGACKENIFSVTVNANNARFTIAAAISYSFSATPTCSTVTPVYIVPVSITGNATNPYFDPVLKEWRVTLGTGTVIISYHVYVDCSVIPIWTGQVGSVNLLQAFTDSMPNGVIFDTDPSPNPSNQFNIQGINVPQFADVSPNPSNPYHTGYLDTLDLFYYYKNTSTDTAFISYTFTDDATNYCNRIQPISLTARDSLSPNFFTITSGNSFNAVIKGGDTLIVRKRVRSIDCLQGCNGSSINFKWKCNNPSLVNSSFCNACQAGTGTSFNTGYRIVAGDTARLRITRTFPDSTQVYNYSCMNDASMQRWRFFITHTGKGALDTAGVQLKIGSGLQFLTLIPDSSFHIYANCLSCTTSLTTIADTLSLCTGAVPNPLAGALFAVKDLRTTDTVFVEFSTYKCSVENDNALLSVGKEYFKTELLATGNTICPATQVAATTNFLTPNFIEPNTGTTIPDVEQHLAFFPSVKDLIVDPGQTYGDYATQEIEMHGYLNQVYDYQIVHAPNASSTHIREGMIRATVYCDTNMRIEHPLTDVKLKWLNPATNSYVYHYADTMLTKVPANTCTAGNYYYFFDLTDTIMRLMLDSGLFEFTMQACCAFDKARTPYHVNFHLLADPSGSCNSISFANDTVNCQGTGCAWLPLSSKGDDIAVHCPGCLAPGVVAQFYEMKRVSFGFQDSDNDGIADNGVIPIDTSSSWYQTNENKLKLNYSSLGDKLQDKFTARFEPGNSSGGGYSYHTELTSHNVRFKYLQLSRFVQAAFDTMRLTVNSYTLYIDVPDSVNNACRSCEGYGIDPLQYRTQYELTVPADSIYLFLDTITNANTFLFNFSAYDSVNANNFWGNLFSHPSLITYADTLYPFEGFTENQHYRLVTNYTECGSFAAPNLPNLTLDQVMRQSNIRNNCWFSGAKQVFSAFDDNFRAPNTKLQAMDSGWVFTSTPGYDTISDAFVNNYIFVCETFSGTHYYFAQNANREISVAVDTGCAKAISITSRLTSAGGQFDIYPYEFRSPGYFPEQYQINIPQGFHSKNNTGYVRHNVYLSNGSSFLTPSTPFTIPAGVNNFTILESNLPPAVCIQESDSTTGPNLFVAGNRIARSIYIPFEPDTCYTDSLFFPDDSTALVRFNIGGYACNPAVVCNNDTSFNGGLTSFNTIVNIPNLTFSYSNKFSAYKPVVCSSVSFANNGSFISNGVNYNYGDAANVFIALPTSAPYLDNWQFINGIDTVDAIGSILPVTKLLKYGTTINGQLCASNVYCLNHADSFAFDWGWSCDTFPTSPYNSNDVCFSHTDSIWFENGNVIVSLSTKVHDSTYTLCQPFEVITEFSSQDLGAVYPFSTATFPMVQGLTVEAVILENCTGNLSDTLDADSIPNTWSITDSNMLAVGYPNSAMSDSACIRIKYLFLPQCSFLNQNIVPPLYINALSYCGDSIKQQTFRGQGDTRFASLNQTDTIIWNDSSECKDCFTLTKTANNDTIAIGDTATFTINVCSHNELPDTLNLTEQLPSSTVFTLLSITPPITQINNFPADTCVNYIVKGRYKAAGNCPDSLFTNKVTLTTATAIYKDSVCINVYNPCIATDTVFADSTFSGKKVYNNKSILIAGRFYVNDSLTLNNCMVYVNPGGQITVLPNATLITNNTIIQSCDTMWRGVTVQSDGKFRMLNNSHLYDANIGITPLAGGTVTVDSSSILDCVRGIFNAAITSGFVNITLNVSRSVIAKVSQGFKPDYIGQPSHGVLPFAGIEVNNIIMSLGTVTGRTNEFYRLNNGLVAHNSIVSVKRTRFYNITKDVFYTGQYQGIAMAADASNTSLAMLRVLPEATTFNTVNNAEYGIYTRGVTLAADYLHLLNVRYGAYCIQTPAAKSSSVTNCTITSRHIGIFLASNPLAKFMSANNNTITINGTVSSGLSLGHYGIWMSEANAIAPVRYIASDNVINLTNATHGLYSGALNRAKLKYNIVKLNGSGNGISVFANRNSSINCNNVTGTYYTGATGNSNAYNIGNNSSVGKNTLYCNSADSTYRGFAFGGQNPSTIFKGNEMNTHWVGLYLNSGTPTNPTFIGTQIHHGNRWNTPSLSFSGMNTTIGGFNMIQLSRFDVDGSLGQEYYPLNIAPPSWFRDTTGITFYCVNTFICSTPPPSLADTTITRLIAEGVFDSEDFSDESRTIAEDYLYRELSDDSLLWESDSVYIEFMLESQDEPVAYLYNADAYFEAAYKYDTTLQVLVDSIEVQMTLFTDSIENSDEWHEANPELDVDSMVIVWTDKVNFLNQTATNINIQRTAIMENNLENAELQSEYVVNAELPETNTANLNEIEINYMEAFQDLELLQANYSTLEFMATQCPFVGGEAVIRARTYLALLNDSIAYDDVNICLQSGIYRKGNDLDKTIENNQSIVIKPNPASDKIDIVLIGNFEGLCKIEIFNSANKVVEYETMDCKEKSKSLNISTMAQGVYTVRISTQDKTEIKKITIVR